MAILLGVHLIDEKLRLLIIEPHRRELVERRPVGHAQAYAGPPHERERQRQREVFILTF
jgi:hypothetical protein